MVWRSVHVHRYGDQDGLLTGGVAPAVAALRRRGVAGFFFLRYWQGGHHLRLRLRAAEGDADALMADLTASVAGYLAEHPGGADFDVDGFREAQPTMAVLEGAEVHDVHPPDTIRDAEYVPEYDKYGGPRGVAIAEEFFDRSSAVVLDALTGIAEQPGQQSGKRLGTGFTMMLRGLCATGLTPPAMAGFLAHYCVLWSPYVFDQFANAWPELLERRRPALLAHVERVLAGRDRTNDLADPFSAVVGTALAAIGDAADEVLPQVTLAGPDAPADRRRQVLLVSYLHTHNNRLGLIPEQEAFLGYLGHHVLSEYAGTPPDAELMARIRAARQRRSPAGRVSAGVNT